MTQPDYYLCMSLFDLETFDPGRKKRNRYHVQRRGNLQLRGMGMWVWLVCLPVYPDTFFHLLGSGNEYAHA